MENSQSFSHSYPSLGVEISMISSDLVPFVPFVPVAPFAGSVSAWFLVDEYSPEKEGIAF